MIWDGRTVFTLWGYRPRTELAIKWHKRSDGNWRGCDRLAKEDVYEANITIEGPLSELMDLETVLEQRRAQFIANFEEGEEIFGADVDHSGDITVMVTDYGKIDKLDFKLWGMPLTIRNINPKFLDILVADFSILRKSSHRDQRESQYQITKVFAYDGLASVVDHLSNDGEEPGIYKANFTQTHKEMGQIRRYIRETARAQQIPFPDFDNMDYPFGTRAGTGPFNCRIIDWSDLGRRNLCDWGLSLTLARDISYWNQT